MYKETFELVKWGKISYIQHFTGTLSLFQYMYLLFHYIDIFVHKFHNLFCMFITLDMEQFYKQTEQKEIVNGNNCKYKSSYRIFPLLWI